MTVLPMMNIYETQAVYVGMVVVKKTNSMYVEVRLYSNIWYVD